MADVNLLVRGQSNALLFCDWGGLHRTLQAIRAALPGVKLRPHYRWADERHRNTINSGTSFRFWVLGGWYPDHSGDNRMQRGLWEFVSGVMTSEDRARPTITLWMHSEDDGIETWRHRDEWTEMVRADTAEVRRRLGQGPRTTPIVFAPVPYNITPWGAECVLRGMDRLAEDKGFNAVVTRKGYVSAWSDGSHYHAEIMDQLGDAMAEALIPVVRSSAGVRGTQRAR